MFNEMTRLRESDALVNLLTHYAELARPDRQAWQERRKEVDGCTTREVTQLHGELIAYGWVEQNTGEVLGCYRATPAGLRALKQRLVDEE